MKNELAVQIVRCLRTRGHEQEPFRRLERFSGRDWEGIIPWLDLSGLSLYFLRRLKDASGESAVPFFILHRLVRNFEDNLRRVQEMAKEFHLLTGSFASSGIAFAVLKGFSLVPDFCPDASLRTQYDYDILIQPSARSRAAEALRSPGYRLKASALHAPHVYARSDCIPRRPSNREEFYSTGLQRSVELHTALWDGNEDLVALRPAEGVIGRTVLRSWKGLTFPALGDEDAIIFQGLHAFHHILHNWCRLSTFLEIAYFMEQKSLDTDFWRRTRNYTKPCASTRCVLGVVFSLAERLFGVSVPAAAETWTTKAMTPAMAQWVELYGEKSALGNFTGDKFSLYLHREFINDQKSWRQIRRRRLFPVHRPHRWTEAATPKITMRLKAGRSQFVYSVKRTAFHVNSALRYALELPRWNRARRGDRGQTVISKESPVPAVDACIPAGVRK